MHHECSASTVRRLVCGQSTSAPTWKAIAQSLRAGIPAVPFRIFGSRLKTKCMGVHKNAGWRVTSIVHVCGEFLML